MTKTKQTHICVHFNKHLTEELSRGSFQDKWAKVSVFNISVYFSGHCDQKLISLLQPSCLVGEIPSCSLWWQRNAPKAKNIESYVFDLLLCGKGTVCGTILETSKYHLGSAWSVLEQRPQNTWTISLIRGSQPACHSLPVILGVSRNASSQMNPLPQSLHTQSGASPHTAICLEP